MALLPGGDPRTWKLDPDNPGSDAVAQLIGNLVQVALTVAGGVAIVMIMVGAFQYLTAYGNEEKATKGRTTLMWAIIGVVVIILAKVIVSWIWNLVAANPINFFF